MGSELDKTVVTGKVPYGTYTVVVSKDGYEDAKQTVVVNGKDVKVDVTLKEVEKMEVSSISAVNAAGTKTALNGATVSRASSFEMTLSKAVDEETVTNSTIKLVKGSETMAISLPTINNGVISFKSLSVLDANAEYKVVVDGIKSKDGKDVITNQTIATFKTTDTVVAKKVVANGTTIYDTTTNDGVSLNVTGSWNYDNTDGQGSVIQVTFDTPVDKSTINSKSIQLIDVTTGKNLAVEGNQISTTQYLNVSVVGSKDYLTPKHQYKLVLDGLKAANGTDIDTFSVTFAYQAGKPASVADASIYNGDLKDIKKDTGVNKLVNPLTTSKMLDNGTTFKAAAAVIVDFGAADVKLDESTITTDYLYIREKDTHKKVAQTISYNKELNRVTLTPSEKLKDDTDYEIFESPYIKNIYGITLGDKDSDYVTTSFKTLDVTAPTVVGQPESSLENKSLINLPLDETFKIRVKMSEKVAAVSLATDSKKFATGSETGNILVTRADDETINGNGIVTASKQTIGKDEYVELTIKPTKAKSTIKGKTFRVTLAGTNPTRKNDSSKVITDAYTTSPNAMANDYSFTFSFEGEDKIAPKITEIKATNGADPTALQGMTNVNLNQSMRVYFDCNDVNSDTISNIKLVDKDNNEYSATGTAVPTGNTSYADITFTGATNVTGTCTLKAQDVADKNSNKSSLQSYDFTAGTGLSVAKAVFKVPQGSKSDDSYVELSFNNASVVDTTTLAGNIKLMNGDKEVPTTIDSTKLASDGIVKVVPSEKLSGNTKYTLVVSKDVKNTDGNLLQQNGFVAAPADYKVDLTTADDAKPAIKGEPTFKDGKLTVGFDTKLARVGSVSVVNSTTNDIVNTTQKVDSDTNVEITSLGKLAKNVQYNVTISVTAKNGQSSTVVTKFSVADDYAPDTRAEITVNAGVNTASSETTVKANIAKSGEFTINFSNPVAVNAVKAMKFTDGATGKEYTPDVVAGAITKDNDGNEYAASYVLDIPGIFETVEFRATLAKGTAALDGNTAIKTKDDIKFVLTTDKDTDAPAISNPAYTTGTMQDVTIGGKGTATISGFTGDSLNYTVSSDKEDKVKATVNGTTINLDASEAADGDEATITVTANGFGTPATGTFKVTVDKTAPTLATESAILLNDEKKELTITFSEDIKNATDSEDALRNAITFATDGLAFSALATGDKVEISDNKVVITFNSALTGSANAVKIGAGALKDVYGNATTTVISATGISAS